MQRRREFLWAGLLGTGLVGLRSLASGVPISVLVSPRTALAQSEGTNGCHDNPQFLVLSTSADGDPITNNCPGTYTDPGIVHPQNPEMAPTALSLGDQSYQAAAAWAALPSWALARACFFHHRTLTNNHADYPKVMRLMGATKQGEMLPSVYAKALGPCLQTVQTEPLSVAPGGSETLSFSGRVLPALPPLGLKEILSAPAGPLGNLRHLRDQTLDQIHGLLKKEASPAARHFIDRYALSQEQARSISEDLLENLGAINGNTARDQLIAAASLVKMRVSPVVTVHIPFGGDNHTDGSLERESLDTISGLKDLGDFFALLQKLGIEDQTTFAILNVFGRPLKAKAPQGRDHWQLHNCLTLIGKNVSPGVVGGLEPTADGHDYQSLPIVSESGLGSLDGDIGVDQSLASAGKTLGRALGLSPSLLDEQINEGKIVKSAIIG